MVHILLFLKKINIRLILLDSLRSGKYNYLLRNDIVFTELFDKFFEV